MKRSEMLRVYASTIDNVPVIIELIDCSYQIERFIADQHDFLEEATVILVSEPIAILFANKYTHSNV